MPLRIWTDEFQPSPGAKAGCDRCAALGRVATIGRFNPHPARKPGATDMDATKSVMYSQFQPSPGAKAGCDTRRPMEQRATSGFNPHPARKPGATMIRHLVSDVNDVSTLTRRESRVRRFDRTFIKVLSNVSTLTRRESRVRPGWGVEGRGAGLVSTLTRRESRVRLAPLTPMIWFFVFQPSPGAKAGCDSQERARQLRTLLFQPSPGAKAGCDRFGPASLVVPGKFQPSPGAKAGCDLE